MTRILTSHVGSLPRSQEVVDFIFARENGVPYDEPSFDETMTTAVHDTVRKQAESGIDIVSDGETSKISYATYVKDRYTGFSGDSPRNAQLILKCFQHFWSALQKKEVRLNMLDQCVLVLFLQKGKGSYKKILII